jgi:flagellar FliJ protein
MAAFRLASLLRVRRLEEDRAASVLGAANARRTESAERRRQDAEQLATSELPRRTDELYWHAAIASRAALGGLLAESTAVAQLTARQASTAEQAWSVARTRAVVLEKLEDRHREAVEAEDLRLDQLLLDEVATRAAGLRARAGRDASGSSGTGSSGSGSSRSRTTGRTAAGPTERGGLS